MSGTGDTDDRPGDDGTDSASDPDARRGDATTDTADHDRADATPDIDEAEATGTRRAERDATEAPGNSDSTTATDTTVKTPTGERSRAETAASEDDSEYATEEDVAALREDVASFADDLEERTIKRDDLEGDLRRYVRGRVRRNHARGWGPYLVLLYGTAMTIAAFYSPQVGGGWAILAMVVIWLSTLGLYALFVIVGLVSNLVSMPGRLLDRIGEWRS